MSDLDRTDDASSDTELDLVIDPDAGNVADPQGVTATPHTMPAPVTIPPSDPVPVDNTADQQPRLRWQQPESNDTDATPEKMKTADLAAPAEAPNKASAPLEPSETAFKIEPAKTTPTSELRNALHSEADQAAPRQAAPSHQHPKPALDMWAVVRDSDTTHNPSAASQTGVQAATATSQPDQQPLAGEQAHTATSADSAQTTNEPNPHDLSASLAQPASASRADSTHAIPQLLPEEKSPSVAQPARSDASLLDSHSGQSGQASYTVQPALTAQISHITASIQSNHEAHTPASDAPVVSASPVSSSRFSTSATPTPSSAAAPVSNATPPSARSSVFASNSTTQPTPSADPVPDPASTSETSAASGTPRTVSAAFNAADAADTASDAPDYSAEAAPHSTSEDTAWQPSDKADEDSPLEQTAVRRRSLITPVDTVQPELEATWKPRETTTPDHATTETPDRFDSQIFAGATVVPAVPKRGKWHALSILITLIVAPLMWYYCADAASRFTLNISQMNSGTAVDTMQRLIPVGELLGVILGLVVVVECAIRSSVGAQVVGILLAILGLPWVVVPDFTADTIYPLMQSAFQSGAFLQNVGHHLQEYGYSGRLLMMGLALWAFGMISHRVRRRGRAEQAIRAQVEQMASAHTPAE